MKKFILALALISGLPAMASTSQKVDELDTEVEAEQLDVYEQRQMEDAARKEAIQFDRQAKQLEQQINSLRAESKNISSRLDRQGTQFKRIVKLAADADRKAKGLERQRNQLKAKSESLQARISQSESRLQSAEEFQRQLSQDIREKNQEQRDLNQRLRAADTRIQRAQAAIKRMRAQQRRLSQTNTRLQDKVASRSRAADRLEERSLENDL